VHRNAKARLQALKHPDTPIPGEIVDERRTIEPGGTRLDLPFVGSNHSDNTLVLHLPKEKIIFTVDWIPIQAVLFRDLPDGFIPDGFDGLDRVLAMDRERMIPGHPGPGGRFGTKDDVRALKEYMTDVSNAARQLAAEGKCLDDEAMNAVRLPKYEGWGPTTSLSPATSSASASTGGAVTDGGGETNRPPLARRAECGGRRPSRT